MKTYPDYRSMLQSLMELFIMLAIVALLTSFVLIIAGAPVWESYQLLAKGALGSVSKFRRVIMIWMPLTVIGCGLLYTFRTGLWNIGVEGQIVAGAVCATWVLRLAGLEPSQPVIYIGLAFLCAVLGGAFWAFITGLLKIKGGVHEIFAGLGMNFVAQGMILWLIFGPWRRPGAASMSGTEHLPDSLWLFAPGFFAVPPVSLGLTLLILVLTAFLLLATKLGLRLKAVGINSRAALLFGMEPEVWLLIAMLLGGGLAGLAGGLQVCGVYHRLIPNISSDYGYLALLVVMLANYRIGYVPVIAFFFACLNVGSIQLPMVLGLDSSLSGIIQGSLVLATLAVHALRLRCKARVAQ